jgi:hypothetical protein
MPVTMSTGTVGSNEIEVARLRVENERLRSENERLNCELNEHKRLLWDRPETTSANEIEDFKERRSVWAYLARRTMELANCFRKSAGTLPRFESMTAMLRHSVSTAAEMNLYNNPDIADTEKEALRQAYADQLHFIEAIDNLVEPKKRSVLEEVKKEASCSPSYEIEAAVLACYEELTDIMQDNGQQLIREGKIAPVQRHKVKLMSTSEAHGVIADRFIANRLKGRTDRAIENMARRARNRIAEARAAVSEGRCPRADDNAIAGFFAYHQARSQLRRETGDALTRVRRLLSRFK